MNEEDVKKVIDDVYSQLIDLVLEGFDQIESEQVKKLYYDYLTKEYSDIIKSKNDIERSIRSLSIMEKSYWEYKSKDYKLSMLVKDTFLNQLGSLNQEAYESALERVKTDKLTVTKEDAEQKISKMKELYSKVQPFNSSIGYNYLLEGIEDFNYACGNSDEHSLRVGRAL